MNEWMMMNKWMIEWWWMNWINQWMNDVNEYNK